MEGRLLCSLPFLCYTCSDTIKISMDYTDIDLCIRSLEEYKPGYYYLDMPSRYDPSDESYILEVDQQTVDILTGEVFNVPMCPPGWPNPPST